MSDTYAFNKDNKGKVDTALDFPRLKLEKKGEKARLAIFGISTDSDGKRALVLPEPEGGFYFDLRVPGHEREYVGSFECLAPEAMKIDGEFDADSCPHCVAVLAGNISEEVMGPRKRKFVMPVIRYKTQGGSSDLVVPHSVEALGWKFTDRYFNVLVDEDEKWEASGGLLKHDVTLTCEVVQWQNFTVSIEPAAAYAEDRDLGKLVIETYLSQTAGLPEGLGRVLGNKLNIVDLDKKIKDTVEAAAQLGVGAPSAPSVPTVDPATIESLATDLLGTSDAETSPEESVEVTQETPVPATVEAGEVDFDDFFKS